MQTTNGFVGIKRNIPIHLYNLNLKKSFKRKILKSGVGPDPCAKGEGGFYLKGWRMPKSFVLVLSPKEWDNKEVLFLKWSTYKILFIRIFRLVEVFYLKSELK